MTHFIYFIDTCNSALKSITESYLQKSIRGGLILPTPGRMRVNACYLLFYREQA